MPSTGCRSNSSSPSHACARWAPRTLRALRLFYTPAPRTSRSTLQLAVSVRRGHCVLTYSCAASHPPSHMPRWLRLYACLTQLPLPQLPHLPTPPPQPPTPLPPTTTKAIIPTTKRNQTPTLTAPHPINRTVNCHILQALCACYNLAKRPGSPSSTVHPVLPMLCPP